MEEWDNFMDKWWQVIRSKTKDEFEENWADLDNNDTIPTNVKTYLWNTWLLDHKTRFVEAWTDQLLHLGAVDSSRVEGAHRILKCYIKVRSYDLRQTWKKIKICVEQQARALAIEDEKSRIGTLASIATKPLYQLILRKATRSAFILMERQRCLPLQDDETSETRRPCTGIFMKTMGLPCGHLLRQREAANQAIQMCDLHRHWHVNREPIGSDGQVEYNPIFDPEPGRRVVGRTARSGRVLSAFEVVEQQRRQQIRHCSACTPRSHNRLLCSGCASTNHTARNCASHPTMPSLPPTQPPLSQASPAPWTIAGGPGFIQNSQFATQNWVLGSSSALPGMVLGAGYPPSSQSTQGGHLQVPGTQYSQF